VARLTVPVERTGVGRAGARLLAPGVDVVVELLLALDHDGHRRIAPTFVNNNARIAGAEQSSSREELVEGVNGCAAV
jgi:hypothetical protein